MIQIKNSDIIFALLSKTYHPKLCLLIKYVSDVAGILFTEGYRPKKHKNDLHGEDPVRAIDGRASIYTHPLGFHGHAAGPTIGLWDRQDGVPGRGDYPLFYNTCHSIELNIKTELPEWGGQEIRIAIEQDAVFAPEGVYYLDGRQTKLHLIK